MQNTITKYAIRVGILMDGSTDTATTQTGDVMARDGYLAINGHYTTDVGGLVIENIGISKPHPASIMLFDCEEDAEHWLNEACNENDGAVINDKHTYVADVRKIEINVCLKEIK